MDRVVRAIELAASFFLALVALLIFVAVVLRYGFAMNLPDAFDFSRYLQGIAILWGLAVCTWRDGHISVDMLWERFGPAGRRWIDITAHAVTTLFFALLAWQLVDRLPSMFSSRQVTNDLALPIWPFFLAAAAGGAACVLLALLKLIRTASRRG